MWETITSNSDLWRYLSIPVLAAVVGWVTNWVALQLTFWPLEYKGIKPFGWQGIIPGKAAHMASITVDASVRKLGSLVDIIDRIGTDVISDHIVNYADRHLEEMVDEIMLDEFAPVWSKAPEAIREQVYSAVRQQLAYTIEEVVFDGVEHLDELVDFKEMVVEALVARPEVLNRMFLDSGREELSFIVNSGLWFGAAFGIVQLLVWIFYPAAWVLPLFGFLIGFCTNWLALNIIFRPLKPTKVGPWTIQGMFLRRQEEVSERYSHILASEVITPRQVMHTMLHGSQAEAMEALVDQQVQLSLDNLDIPREMMVYLLGEDCIEKLSRAMARQFLRRSAEPFDDDEFNRARAKDVQALINRRMRELSPEEFQNVLRPAFQEDEWLLILAGAVLGMMAGMGQWFFVFKGLV